MAMSGQMMGVVLVDEHAAAVRPALIWADTRAHEEAGRLAERVGAEHGYELLGHPIDPTYCLAKLMWLRDHEPRSWARTRTALVAKDFLTLRLTGRRCTDPSDAAGTNAWDQVAGTWSAEMLAAAGIDPGLLPEVVPSATVAGGLGAAAARASGLRAGHARGGRGRGRRLRRARRRAHHAATRSANATIGSSAWISIASETPLRDPLRRVVTFDHVIPGRYAPLGAMQAAGTALEWVAGTLGAARPASLGGARRGRRRRGGRPGWPVLPALPARRAGAALGPARARHVRGPGPPSRPGASRASGARRRRLQPRRHASGRSSRSAARSTAIDAVGGGARSDVWLRIMADTWGVPVRRRTIVDEANSLGAAVVGGVAVGLIEDWSTARSLSSVEATFEPDPARHEGLRDAGTRFEDAYARLRTWFR